MGMQMGSGDNQPQSKSPLSSNALIAVCKAMDSLFF